MTHPFDLDNSWAERAVVTRFTAFWLVLIPIGLALSDGFVSAVRGVPFSFSPLFWGITTLFAVPLALVLGYLTGRAVVQLSVPKAVCIEPGRIVGDFDRVGWPGYKVREIRFDDIRAIRPTYLLRIPLVRGHPDYSRTKPVVDSALFYLSRENMELLKAGVANTAGWVAHPT